MGQGSSQPERRADGPARPSRRAAGVFRRPTYGPSTDESQQDGLLSGPQHARHTTSRSSSINRLSQLFHADSASLLQDRHDTSHTAQHSRSSAVLHRTRSTMRDFLSRRERSHLRSGDSTSAPTTFLQHRTSYLRAGMNSQSDADYPPPRLPSIDLTSTFDSDTFTPPEDQAPTAPRSSSSHRRPNLRLNALRPERPFRHFPTLRRRRHSPDIRRISGAEDQAAMLSRLLSVAAAATAATLMGDDHHALHEARSLTGSTGVGDIGASGEDGSFDGFLRALQNGRIASALRGGGDSDTDASGGSQGPLNFFRMFRFASSPAQSGPTSNVANAEAAEDGNGGDGRMIPIIIVGIRSITPDGNGSGSSSGQDLPPFIDALGSFPSPLPAHALGAHGHDSIDSILRPPQNGTSFRHRRRASLGGFGMSRNQWNDRMDEQRHHRSPDRRRERPWSVASSSSALEPRPPPATPASPSPELSRISSRNATPGNSRPASIVGTRSSDLGDSRRNSILHRGPAGSPLSSHTEETGSLHSTHSSTNLLPTHPDAFSFNSRRRSDTAPNIHYPRFASGHSRRHGVVEPLGDLPSLSRSSTSNSTDQSGNGRRNSSNDSRSWIIYVLGGSYPENHPILTTPSLFTDNPTYEDMMLLSALLGPAKAPVATEEEVESAGGLYNIEVTHVQSDDAAKTAGLVAVAVESDEQEDTDRERVELEAAQRCLVCLGDFEIKDVVRKLVKCNHLFHRECIDQWLTQERNSCPLCRGQGVNEKEKAEDTPSSSSTQTSSETDTSATTPATSDEAIVAAAPEVEQAS